MCDRSHMNNTAGWRAMLMAVGFSSEQACNAHAYASLLAKNVWRIEAKNTQGQDQKATHKESTRACIMRRRVMITVWYTEALVLITVVLWCLFYMLFYCVSLMIIKRILMLCGYVLWFPWSWLLFMTLGEMLERGFQRLDEQNFRRRLGSRGPWWHYLSNATCRIQPHLLSAALLV